jgi:hypothetical protein
MTFPARAGTSSRACGRDNKSSRPKGQELRKAMIAIDAAGTKVEEAEQHKTCPEALVNVAVFKLVCTLVHDSSMFNRQGTTGILSISPVVRAYVG